MMSASITYRFIRQCASERTWFFAVQRIDP